MRELRELYSKTSDMWECMKISVECLSYAESKEAYYETIAPVKETVKDLIESMHNHLPELLDAWEMVKSQEYAQRIATEHLKVMTAWWEGAEELYEQVLEHCKTCLFHGDCNDATCEKPYFYRDEWLSAYREAQKNEGVE